MSRMISPSQGAALVRLARATIEERLSAASPHPPAGSCDPFSASSDPRATPIEGRFGGAFITLRRGERLRGCVGQIVETSDLTACVKRAAAAVLHDDRFSSHPVTAAELPTLRIEVSVLSPPTPMRTSQDITPGVHGVIIHRGGQSGCFLPKVATMQRWDAETFLSQCCVQKAGLPAGAWREPQTRVLLFTVEEFHECEEDRERVE
ncbi:MAG: AmmeMemoRadiSam system protein A [Phycisphaerales bacterium]|nr:AmmeMemoRadiSam system protein A [Phycisphaerales bacterium]